MITPAHSTVMEAPAIKCAFVLHGLNANPKRMEDLAALAKLNGYEPTIGVLSGHHNSNQAKNEKKITAENWKSEFQTQWNSSTTNCRGQNDQRLFIAYSLGALLGVTVFDGPMQIQLPTKMILIAPALTFQAKTMLLRALSFLPFGGIPSANHPEYRVRGWTSFAEYDALFKLNKEWKKTAWSKTANVKTLLALEPKDELVDSDELAKQIQDEKIQQWTIEWITNQSSTLRPKYHHLIIDEKSQGTEQWKAFSDKIGKFLSQAETLR